MRSSRFLFLLSAAALLASGEIASAAVKLPNVISNHMVLQQSVAAPIWGTAAPEERVTVKFRDQSKSAVADKDGNWSVKLDPLKAGGPDVLTVTGTNELTINDVLIGEVWIGSGQSNMAGTVANYAKTDPMLAELAKTARPKMRFLKSSGVWAVSTTETNQQASAILFAFGVRLQDKLDTPVGLMLGAVGGTPSGYWLTQEMLDADSGCQEQASKYDQTHPLEVRQKRFEVLKAAYEKQLEAAKAANKNPPRVPVLEPAGGKSNGIIGHLFNAHIRPMAPYAFRGVLWDQGESGTAIGGVDQFNAMHALILGWRKYWNQGDFPFLYVQKVSGLGCAWDYSDPVTNMAEKFSALPAAVPNDGQYRELHIRIMQHPQTAMVTSSDLGTMTHPLNKSGYGTRAAQVARGFVYGEKVEYYGPTYESHSVEGDKVRVRYTHVGKGLAFRNGDKLQGFAVAGADKSFRWATATIDGDSVVLNCPEVKEPKFVRYGWSQNQTWANLFNQDGLPAIPFRTDKD